MRHAEGTATAAAAAAAARVGHLRTQHMPFCHATPLRGDREEQQGALGLASKHRGAGASRGTKASVVRTWGTPRSVLADQATTRISRQGTMFSVAPSALSSRLVSVEKDPPGSHQPGGSLPRRPTHHGRCQGWRQGAGAFVASPGRATLELLNRSKFSYFLGLYSPIQLLTALPSLWQAPDFTLLDQVRCGSPSA